MTQPTSKKGVSPVFKVIFGVSLALNIAVIGAVGAAAWRFSGEVKGPLQARAASATSTGSLYIRALSREDRRELGQDMRRHFQEMHPSTPQVQNGFQQALTLLRAEPLDRDALAQIMSSHLDLTFERQRKAQSILLEKIVEMSPEDRIEFADRLEHALSHGGKRKKKSD